MITPTLRFFPLLTTLFLCMALLSGCGDSSTDYGDPGNGTPPPGNGGDDTPEMDEVFIQGLNYTPSSRTIPVGTTVTWTNQSNMVHTVTSGSNRMHNGLFDSGDLTPGDTFSYTFDEPGTYPYFCRPHVGMSGTVVVE